MTDRDDDVEKSSEEHARRAKEHTIAGGALGVASASGFVLMGSVACPLCVVAAPVLLCSGAWNAHKSKKDEEAKEEDMGCDGTVAPAKLLKEGG